MVAYVVTDVKRIAEDVEDQDYDVTVDDVRRWKLTNLPVRWEHVMPDASKAKHECSILSHDGIGRVKNWWLDFSPRWDSFAVGVLLEIHDPDVLSSPAIDQYRCVSLTYLARDHGRCIEISLVRTGQRNSTAGQFVPRKMLDEVCSAAFGFPRDQYKRRCIPSGDGTSGTAMESQSVTSPTVLQGNEDGTACNALDLENGATTASSCSEGNDESAVKQVLQEAETIQSILEKIPSREGESLLKLIEDRNKRVGDVESKVNRRLETWSVQLRDLLNRFSESIDGKCGAEIEKRKEDVDKLHRQLDGINDVWKRMELITASFETVSKTLSSNKSSDHIDTKKTLLESVRKKWPKDVKVTVRETDEIEQVLDRYSDAIRKGEALESKRRNDTLDRYLNIVKGQLKQAAATNMSDSSEGLSRDEVQWIRHLKRKSQEEGSLVANSNSETGTGTDASMKDEPKRMKSDGVPTTAETIKAGFQKSREPQATILQGLSASSSSSTKNVTESSCFNYWKDRKTM